MGFGSPGKLKMKILFVYPDVGIRGGALSFQFGLGHLSSFVKSRGHLTELHYVRTPEDMCSLNSKIDSVKPDIVAFTSTSPQYKNVRRMAADLKDERPFTICGGPHVTLYPEALAETPGLDAVCRGEGEDALLEVLNALGGKRRMDDIPGLWVKTPEGIKKNAPPSFMQKIDELPFPDRGLYDYQSVVDSDFGTALFMFSRGCPFECTYCSNHALRKVQDGRYVRFRSVDNCLDEIAEVLANYKIGMLYFNDDVFTMRKDYVKEFCEKYARRFKNPFQINARVETLDLEICSMLKKAGCLRIDIGIESGCEEFRRKVLKRRMSNDDIIKAFESAKEAGLKTKSFNIVGYPLETKTFAEETVALNRQIQPDSVVVYIFEPYPGTELYSVSLEKGFLEGNPWEADFIPRTDTVLEMPGFPREEIVKIYRNFGYNVYRGKDARKALFYKVYYWKHGEALLKLASPAKKTLRKLFMGI